MVNFSVSYCDLVDIITETIRFLCHITILHLINYAIEDKEKLFETNYLKVMLFKTPIRSLRKICIIVYSYCTKINKNKNLFFMISEFSDQRKE